MKYLFVGLIFLVPAVAYAQYPARSDAQLRAEGFAPQMENGQVIWTRPVTHMSCGSGGCGTQQYQQQGGGCGTQQRQHQGGGCGVTQQGSCGSSGLGGNIPQAPNPAFFQPAIAIPVAGGIEVPGGAPMVTVKPRPQPNHVAAAKPDPRVDILVDSMAKLADVVARLESREAPKPQDMKPYYDKLTEIEDALVSVQANSGPSPGDISNTINVAVQQATSTLANELRCKCSKPGESLTRLDSTPAYFDIQPRTAR
jgi:hypothetical protein